MLDFAAAVPDRIASYSSPRPTLEPFCRQVACGRAVFARRAMELLLCCLIAPLGAIAQNAAATAEGAISVPDAAKPAASAPPLPRVTTTVVVHGETADNYLPETVTVGTLDGATPRETPFSATVVTRELLTDQVARLLSEVVKNDASVGENYAPVGYYGNYEIRGFPIDLATGLQINGMTIAGEQDVPLENKQSVEFLKGIAGVESGVASAGGLINFVTKRPTVVKALDVATDHRGSSFGAVDLGRLFGGRKQVGARVNLAGEKMQSYVDETDGWRAMGAGAADWKLTPKAILKGDFEYQHKVQRSVCGYQLLGGETASDEPSLPDIHRLYPSTLLGEQSWTKPNTFDTFNAGARFDYDLPRGWKAFAAVSYSHSLIDDNVIYPYGCTNDPACTDLGGTTPDYYFAPDGSYDIFDYRNPGELRINAQAEALVIGHIKTGAITHDLSGGGELLRRSVQQPKHSVNEYIGSENIYEPNMVFPIESVDGAPKKPGPRVLDDNNHQSAAVVQDRIHIPGRIQLLVSGREDSLRDHNYSGSKASGDLNFTSKTVWLPQYAVTFNPISDLTLYGNYGVLLSLGLQAPWWTDNDEVYLDSYLTRQAEIGAKYEPNQHLLLTTAFFHMRAPFFYPKVVSGPDSFCAENFNAAGPDYSVHPGDLCFESEGHETHDGVEASAEGKAANWLRLTASAAAIRAVSEDTGTLSMNHKQVTNVPHLRTALFADLLLPRARGLHLMPGWSYTGRKEATGDNHLSVSSYNIFNLGARYTPGGGEGHVTFRMYADNITNRRYWKDTGSNYGDTFLHMGAPTTVRLSAHYIF
jgi:iron complex outermembrane recepter protein